MKKTLFILTLAIFGLIINQSCKKQDEELKKKKIQLILNLENIIITVIVMEKQ